MKEDASEGYLKIYNLNGGMIFSKFVSNFNDYISIGEIKSGSYFLVVETSAGRYTQKLMLK